MSSIWPIIFSLILPPWALFLPKIALISAWSAVLGVKRRDWPGIAGAVIAGLVIDALAVEALGVTSAVAAFVWFVSGFSSVHFGRPLMVAVLSALAGPVIFGIMGRASFFPSLVVAAAASAIMTLVWSFFSGRREAIKLR